MLMLLMHLSAFSKTCFERTRVLLIVNDGSMTFPPTAAPLNDVLSFCNNNTKVILP